MNHKKQDIEYMDQLLNKLTTVPDVDGETVNSIIKGTLGHKIKKGKYELIILNNCEEKTISKTRIAIQNKTKKLTNNRLFYEFFLNLREPNQEKIINKIEEYIITYN